ncbi:hypothetical protein Y88_3041 [Novosphingobium nitrogenifigens DSM 19370]|uniref:Outer membrane chaperone Skp (OmpH) n=1 Tax=Novosphingobium nitrogenifigens DSM 19370 TaxID=983920 RepID=F1ZC78_9SPHN|nr:OmpH family outer membrane protein [Novosphingobium nitrogenifigens]EGD57715.1 hypothetical protein Y88_3041 [Novosphingobium nitrogenifigens DSM 19370]
MKLSIASAALVAGLSLAAIPAVHAQAVGTAVAGLAVANPTAVVYNSNAFKNAVQSQIPTTYKAQIDQYNTRKAQIQAQIQPLVAKYEADAKSPKPDQAALRTQAAQIQQIQEAGERELQQIGEPINLAQQFVTEQISEKLDAATQAAMTKRKVTLVLDQRVVVKGDDTLYNLNKDIIEQINLIVPQVGVTPPAGWLPRAQREQQAQEQAAAAQQSAAPARKQPEGR